MGFGRGLAPCLMAPHFDSSGLFFNRRLSPYFLVGWPTILLLVFWWSTKIRVHAVDMLFIVVWPILIVPL
jgi:hypothetical protein